MANQEHLAILRQGVEVWNQWRVQHHLIYPDLNGADLKRVDLKACNLSHASLDSADLSNAIDFSSWRENDAYQLAFTNLLQLLKREV